MRRGLIWLGVAVATVAATAGLLFWTTSTAAQFRVDGPRLDLSGQLTIASTERLDRLLEDNPQLSTVVIRDIRSDGPVTSLLQKGVMIRRAGLDTQVGAGVTLRGNAVYLLMGGVERSLGEEARLVPSGWNTTAGPAADLPRDHPAHQERLDYVTRMLGSADAYWASLEQDGAAGRALERDEALELGILTR